MIKRFYVLLLAIVASVGMSWALTPQGTDTWDDATKTLTVNSNPGNEAYQDQSDIKHVVISSTVTSIGNFAFSTCFYLETVIASEGLTTIGEGAFSACENLESVTLPSTLLYVDQHAFAQGSNLKSVTITAPALNDDYGYGVYVFEDTHADLKIYVPAESVETYKTKWSDYADKIVAIGSGSTPAGNSITINESSHGSVVASPTSAEAGETITLTATPDDGYQLKSISGVYVPVSETLNATSETVNGNKFQAQATSRNNRGWRVYNPGTANTLTVSSLNGTTLITKIEFTSTWGGQRKNDMLSVSAGTLSFDLTIDPDTIVTINDINATSVTISGSGTNAGGTWCISSVKVYTDEEYDEVELEISDTENANVKTFTMVDSEVTISAEFEAVAPDPQPVVLPATKYAVCNVPDGWAVTANGDAVSPISGRYYIADGQTVVLTPTASMIDLVEVTSAEETGLLGSGTAEDPYLIYTVANWNAVAAKVNDGTQAAPNCRQMANLDGVTTVMGNSESKPFKGIYDGNGFVFTNINLSITSGSNPLGLFGCVNDASAVVKNVVVAGGTVSSTSRNVGAIVGQLNGGTVQYCANYATVSSSFDGAVRMGGIVGWMRSAGGDNNRVDYCINYGNVSGVAYAGGITGSCGAGYVSYCQNYGSISSSATSNEIEGSAGGIIGWYNPTTDASKITYNHNGGHVTEAVVSGYNPSRYIIANTNSISLPGSNSYLSSLTLTIGSDSYTGAELATHEPNAQALDINPEGIAISGITYAYNTPAPVAPTPGTNPGTDPEKQSNKTWQFTMPSHNIGLTVIIYPAEVIAKINNIPATIELKLATRDSIEGARAAYDALTADQQALVPAETLKKLTDAEAALAALNPGGGMPAGALNGKFSINADGDQISFSKGNLQATTTDLGEHWTWGFAANQWDNIWINVANNKINGNGTVSENGTVDLFCWSTSGTYYGINNSGFSAKDVYQGDFVDWSTNMGAGWRTLTKDEWNYLIDNCTKGRAAVNGKNGYIFLPDEWSGPAFTANPDDFTTNTYDGDDWTAMENAGAVFLPYGPARNGTSALIAMDVKYWSSTSVDDDNSYVFTFYTNQSQSDCTSTRRYYGCMVRLVTEGGGATPLDSAQAVKDLIEAIPAEITLEDACVNAIQAARDAYNALTEATKGALDDATVNKLNQAIADYTALIQAGADEVIAKINNIPDPVTLKLATRDSIQNARAAYDALTADQQALVTNYQTLLDAEEALAAINPGGGMPAGVLSGKFAINAEGDQIAFAKGNLQATTEDLGETWTWGFAANQWEVIGNAAANNAVNGNGTVSANGTVDLFGWSTPMTYYGIHNSTNSDYYSDDFREWGENITGATWKTLSPSDWIYIIYDRADAAQKHGQATVNGVNGYIFLPDEWVLPSGLSFTAKPNNWTANVYEGDDWTAMENAGAVFLPKSPWRSGNTVSTLPAGYYWSSDYNSYSQAMAYAFQEDASIKGTGINRFAGIPVRLVTADAGSPAPLDSAQAVKDLIDAIPVPVTLNDSDAIQAARTAYDALADLTKGALDAATVQKLTDAEAAYAQLIQAATDVIALINAIPQPVVYNEACGDSIIAARNAYDALSDELKAIVSNYQTLLDAEDTYAALAPRIWTSGDCQVVFWPGDSAMIVSKLPGEGNGVMADYEKKNNVPWVDYQLAVKTLTIESGVTEIGSCAFYDLRNLEGDLVIPEGVTAIHENGFRNCLKLTSITLPSTITLLGDNADSFNNCKATDVYITADPNKLAWNEDFDDFIYSYAQASVHKTTVCHVPADYYEIYVAKFDTTVNVTFVGDLPNALSEAEHQAIDAVKDSIDAIGAEITYPASGAAIDAARSAYDALDDDLKPFVSNYQTLLDAEDAYADAKQAHDAVAYAAIDKINAIPVPVEYSSKAAIDTARVAYDALLDTQKALVPDSILQKLTDAEAAWAAIAEKVEHNVSYMGKDGELKNEIVALLNIPDPAPEFNGYEFDHWDVKAGDFLEEGLRIKAVYTPIITTNPQGFDTLAYNGLAQELVKAGVAKEGHIEYRINDGEWSAELPKATFAAAYVVYYKLVREGHEDYLADSIVATIAKAPVAYTAPTAYDTLVYNYNMQTLIEAGITNDGIFEYTLTPGVTESWNVNLPQAQDAGTYAVYYRVIGDINHFDSTAVAPVAVTIAKRDIVVEAPVAYDTLVFNAAEQTLVIAGSADFNVMEYSLDTTVQNCWSIELPKAVTADPYTVYYRVPGDDNHNEYEAQSIAALIAQAPLTITAEDSTIIYGDAIPEFIATYSGLQGQDDETVVSNLAFSCAYQQGSYIGTYVIQPHSATAHNYAISFVNGTLTVNKAHVYVSGAEVHKAKFADGHAIADVTKQGILNGIKLNDPIAHVTTAAFSSADVAENLTITLFYELTGDAALLNNYNLDPTSEIFTNEGVIIEPFIPNNEDKPEEEEAKVQEGIEIYAYGYCDDSGYSLKYHLESGNPDQYMIDYADSRFTDVTWTNLTTKGKDGTIDIKIPVDMPTGDYTMTVYFRDSRFDWLESRALTVTFHVNLPDTYVRPLFDNVIALVDTCHCLTDIQWYWRANSSDPWQPIEGANGYYYHADGKLTGEYFVSAKMNGEPTYTCGQTDMETLYGADKNEQAAIVKAYPNPVVTTTKVTIENSDSFNHNLRVVNLMGVEVMNTSFEGNETQVDMYAYPQGNYMITVDGIVVKVMKQ